MAEKIIIACSGGKHIGKSIARKKGFDYKEVYIERFPDTEIKLRIPEVKGKEIYFIQSFFKDDEKDINDRLVEVLFCAKTAKELGAKKINLIAPYLAYLREDIRFKKGEAVSAKIIADLFKIFNKVYVVEPHLHRFKRFDEFFPNAVKVILSNEFASYIKRKIGKCILVGPDIESLQWVKPVAKRLGYNHIILTKKRFSSRKVKVKGERVRQERVVIIDDIISTGKTLIQASKLIKGKIYFIASHGVFSEDALNNLGKIGRVIVSNTIPSKVSKIDCSSAIANAIK